MTIYFNSDKQACAFELEDAIATIDDETWSKYAGTELGRDYDIINGKFVQLKTPTEIDTARQTSLRISELKRLLAETDYQAIKYAEGHISEQEYAPIKAQRQAWRDEINQLENDA